MSRWFKYLSLIVGGLGAWTGGALARPVQAQDGAMTELYGYGVHRYYAGDYSEAQRVLNIVVEAGIEDPRPHFFRGLTEQQLGMLDAAQADFEHGADLEARGRRAVNVSFALQRVQGPVRQTIEMARLMARVAVYREQLTRPSGAVRPELNVPSAPAIPGADSGLPPSLAPEAGAVPGVVPPPPNAMPLPDTEVNPFRDDQPVPPPSTEPAPAPGAAANPFDSSAAPAAPAAPVEPAAATAPAVAPEPPTPADDPFATPAAPADSAAPPAEPAAPATPEPAAEASPFGS